MVRHGAVLALLAFAAVLHGLAGVAAIQLNTAPTITVPSNVFVTQENEAVTIGTGAWQCFARVQVVVREERVVPHRSAHGTRSIVSAALYFFRSPL